MKLDITVRRLLLGAADDSVESDLLAAQKLCRSSLEFLSWRFSRYKVTPIFLDILELFNELRDVFFLRRCASHLPQRRGPDFAAAPRQECFHSDHEHNPWVCRRRTRTRLRECDNPIVKWRQSSGLQLSQHGAKFVAWVSCSSFWRIF